MGGEESVGTEESVGSNDTLGGGLKEVEPLLEGAGLCAVVGNFWPMHCWVHLMPSASRHALESHSHLHLSQFQLPLPHPPIGSLQAATGFNDKLIPEKGEREGV